MNQHEEEEENMAPKRKDYIGFIHAAAKDKELTSGFFSKSKKSAKELKDFFHKEGFTEIELEHSKLIKKGMKAFPEAKEPGDSPCPSNTHY